MAKFRAIVRGYEDEENVRKHVYFRVCNSLAVLQEALVEAVIEHANTIVIEIDYGRRKLPPR